MTAASPTSSPTAAEVHEDDEVVEYCEECERSPMQVRFFKIFKSLAFDAFFASVVGVNLCFVIIESDTGARGDPLPTGLVIMNTVFLAMYSLEIGLRIFVFRMAFFYNKWNCVDAGLVVADLAMVVVDAAVGSAPSLSFLRLLRLLKLTRGIKVMMLFPQLALMVKGLAKAFSIILWGSVILSVALVAFGIFATQLIHPVNMRVAEKGLYDGCERCPRAYSSVYHSVMTISQQVIAGDSWGLVSIPVIEEAPETVVYFIFCYSVISLMMMNVILAVVVETSSKAATEDAEAIIRNQEKEFQKSAQTFKAMCRELDEDHSGSLTIKELTHGFETNPRFRQIMALMQIEKDDIEAVFNILDKDGSGDIDYDEFITELYKMKSHDQHTMLVFMRYYLMEIKRMLQNVVDHQDGHCPTQGPSPRKDGAAHPTKLAELPAQACIAEKAGATPLVHVEHELRDSIVEKVQSTLREELAVSTRETLASLERQSDALEDLRQRLALPPSRWRGPGSGAFDPPQHFHAADPRRRDVPVPPKAAAERPSDRCCAYVHAAEKTVVSTGFDSSRGSARRGADALPNPVPPRDPYLQGASSADREAHSSAMQAKRVGIADANDRRF